MTCVRLEGANFNGVARVRNDLAHGADLARGNLVGATRGVVRHCGVARQIGGRQFQRGRSGTQRFGVWRGDAIRHQQLVGSGEDYREL